MKAVSAPVLFASHSCFRSSDNLIPLQRLLIRLSRTSTQLLSRRRSNAKKRTNFISRPFLRRSSISGAATHGDAITAYDTDIADRLGNFRLCTPFFLANRRICTTAHVAGFCGAFQARTEINTALAKRCVDAGGKVTKDRCAFNSGARFQCSGDEIQSCALFKASRGERRC